MQTTKTTHAVLQLFLLAGLASVASAQRVTIPLNGSWTIGDSVDANTPPASYDHTVMVPGLVHSAKPAFPEVDQYETQEWIGTMIRDKIFPASEAIETPGRTRQQRMYFWYRRSFQAPPKRERASLVVNKAQFGTAVWLNGKSVGEHNGCFTAGHFDLTGAMHWDSNNELMIRVGAHPGALPPTVIYGGDGEKEFWTPGIYDDVTVLVSDAPAIESVQVAPRIQSSQIVVETVIHNTGPARAVKLRQLVNAWKGGQPAAPPLVETIAMAAGESKAVRQTIRIPNPNLWTPDHPFLYTLETSTGGDSATVRFGMRELHFDGQKAILNGQPIYLRGASITLHRFFSDPDSAGLPWDDNWVRKVLVEKPKQLNMNAFRICIGPTPQRWLDIADEGGILLQYEFPIWDDRKPLHQKLWDQQEILNEFKEFMRDNWNHPSLILWDASNETHWSYLGDKVIPAVRTLDLSNRPWENGYNGPQGPDDPYEIHPYKFLDYFFRRNSTAFEMSDLEKPEEPMPVRFEEWPGHASIIDEYDWLWLHRDGQPTVLTQKVFDHLAPNGTADERFAKAAYLLAGLTEYFRAFRKHAAVLYLAYLDGDGPHIYTCDNFRDVRTLEFQPHFEEYMKEALKPVGVYIDFWQPALDAGKKRSFRILMVNDTDKAVAGKLHLSLEPISGGSAAAEADTQFAIPAFGQAPYDTDLSVPQIQGDFTLQASAKYAGAESPTLSRRNVAVTEHPR